MFHSKQTDEFPLPPVSRCWRQHCVHLFWFYEDRKSSLYLHWGNSSCWGCPHWNSTERAPGHLVNRDILSTATCKERTRKHLDFRPSSCQNREPLCSDTPQVFMHQALTENTHSEATGRACSLLENFLLQKTTFKYLSIPSQTTLSVTSQWLQTLGAWGMLCWGRPLASGWPYLTPENPPLQLPACKAQTTSKSGPTGSASRD